MNKNMFGMGMPEVIIIVCIFLIPIVINAFICLLLQRCFERIPQQFRQQQPGMVWLLLIPCFSLVWGVDKNIG